MKAEDVVIIGAGPAGIATALQLFRYKINPLIIEKSHIGGLLKNACLVENYPGFPDGIKGPELTKFFEKHLKNSGIRVLFEEVKTLSYEDEIFKITTENSIISSRITVVASGTKPKLFKDIHIPEEVKNMVFYEIQDIQREKGKRICIVGSGDSGLDYSLNLARKNHVILINRGDKLKGLPILQERITNAREIEIFNNTFIKKISLDEKRRSIQIVCSSDDRAFKFHVDYILFAIGREPNMDFLSEKIKDRLSELQEMGKLYFAGDVKNKIFRQTAIAVGDGIRTAMMIAMKIKEF